MLRDYQQRAIDQLYDWFRSNESGHPCLVLPTGAGKSHIVAALCKDALQSWPETTVLMLTHVKELIEQNAEKMRQHWPNAPMGIYSASIGKRQLGEPITFAGIQSVAKKSAQLGHIDLCVIDECHLVSHKDEGGYRKLINELLIINPAMRVVGLTATPYRLSHGLITDKPALFDDLIEPVSIEELIHKGYLSKLKSKITKSRLSTDGVHKRGGEFIESELQAAVDNDQDNYRIIDEVISLAESRRSWLFFCAGVKHAEHIKQCLIERGISAECVTGETSKGDRQRILDEFKAGKIKALTNANVLTTGFDAPNIDLIAMLRPTCSAGLYVQMAGRGLRLKEHTDHCLVLDFAGVVETHGPITNVRTPDKTGGEGNGEAPVKPCPECAELVHISAMKCPECGYDFPAREKPKLHLRDIDIMGKEPQEMPVKAWKWRTHTSRTSGKQMLKATYYGPALSDPQITEYFAVTNEGYGGDKARKAVFEIASKCGCPIRDGELLEVIANDITQFKPPSLVRFVKDGKFFNVKERLWTM